MRGLQAACGQVCSESETAPSVFVGSRSSNFVYVPNNEDCFSTLEAYCETSDMTSKLPMAVVGEPGGCLDELA